MVYLICEMMYSIFPRKTHLFSLLDSIEEEEDTAAMYYIHSQLIGHGRLQVGLQDAKFPIVFLNLFLWMKCFRRSEIYYTKALSLLLSPISVEIFVAQTQ